MAGERFFAKVRPGVTLINTSRGPVVDVDALEAAMRDGRVRAAGLDVLPKEPPQPEPGLLRAWRADEALTSVPVGVVVLFGVVGLFDPHGLGLEPG